MSSFTTPLVYEPTGGYASNRPLYRVTEPFEYAFGSIKDPLATFVIPAGFVTDLASIPWPIDLMFRPDGPWAKAAVLHDWLMQTQPDISAEVQDSIFLEAMHVLGVNRFVALAFFGAVRLHRSTGLF